MTRWWCVACGRPASDPFPSRPSLDPTYAVAACGCRRVTVAIRDERRAVAIARATAEVRAYHRALRKRASGKSLSAVEAAALAARDS